MYFGAACTGCAALVLRKPSLVFFLPLAFNSNLVLLLNYSKMFAGFNILYKPLKGTILSNWVSLMDIAIMDYWPTVPIWVGIVVTFFVAVSGLIVRRTRMDFRRKDTRKGMAMVAMQNGASSGLFIAMQFGLPVLISCLATWFTSSPVPTGNLVLAAVIYPCVACITLGATLGSILGFVSVIATSWKRWLAVALVPITGAILALEICIGSLEGHLTGWIIYASVSAIIIVLMSVSEKRR